MMDSGTSSLRTFYNRSSKTSPTKNDNTSRITTTFFSSQHLPSAETPSTGKSTIQPQLKKFIGVRKVLNRDFPISQSSTSACLGVLVNEYKHGLDNPLIQTLMNSNPNLLAQCLAYRYYLKGRPCSDYVLSLFLQGQPLESESRNRKRTIIKCNTYSTCHDKNDLDTNNNNNNSNKTVGKRAKTSKKNESITTKGQSSKREMVTSSPDDNHTDKHLLDHCNDLQSDTKTFHQDIITTDEIQCLNDVLDELQSIRKRKNDSTNLMDNTFYVLDHSMIFNPDSTQDHHDNETSESNDDLIWLTKTMEKEWLQFLSFSGIKISKTDTLSSMPLDSFNETIESKTNSNSISIRTHDIVHCYKAYIAMGKRNQQCDLGYFSTIEEAARIFDMYAIGRRSLGKIAMKEFDLRKRVKARSIFHRLNRNLCNNDVASVVASDVSRNAHQHLDTIKADFYFTSEKVIYPDLNQQPVHWNYKSVIFGLDTSRFEITKEKVERNTEVIELLKEFHSNDHLPIDWLKSEVKSLYIDQKDLNTLQNNYLSQEMMKELDETNQRILKHVTKLERLVRLETNMNQIILKGNIAYEKQIDTLKNG